MATESIYAQIDNITQEVGFKLFAGLSSNDKIITLIEVILILIFLIYAIKLFISWFRDKRQMKILHRILEQYTVAVKKKNSFGHFDISNLYEELVDDVSRSNTKLQQLWKNFDASLIKRVQENKLTVTSTEDASCFFNKRTMITHPSYKLFSSIPGMLLLIGVVGAFIGVYFAITSLTSHDMSKLQESLNILTHTIGAYFAQIQLDAVAIRKVMDVVNIFENMFTTYITNISFSSSDIKQFQSSLNVIKDMGGIQFNISILGLILAIILTSKYKLLEINLEKKLDEIQVSIDQIFIREHDY